MGRRRMRAEGTSDEHIFSNKFFPPTKALLLQCYVCCKVCRRPSTLEQELLDARGARSGTKRFASVVTKLYGLSRV